MSDDLDPKEIVRAGYDIISRIYRGDEEGDDCAHYHRCLDELEPLLPPGTPVLDLGCGCGVPVAPRLAAGHPLIGVDISPVQIERARRNVPGARFLCTDMATLDLPPPTWPPSSRSMPSSTCLWPSSQGSLPASSAGCSPAAIEGYRSLLGQVVRRNSAHDAEPPPLRANALCGARRHRPQTPN